jgi:hypothetical protein
VADSFNVVFVCAGYQIQTSAAATSATFTGGSSTPASVIVSVKAVVATSLPGRPYIVSQAVKRAAFR